MKLYLVKHLEAEEGYVKEGFSFVLADTEELAKDKVEDYVFARYPKIKPNNKQVIRSIKLVKERVII